MVGPTGDPAPVLPIGWQGSGPPGDPPEGVGGELSAVRCVAAALGVDPEHPTAHGAAFGLCSRWARGASRLGSLIPSPVPNEHLLLGPQSLPQSTYG